MPTDGNLYVDAVDRFARSFGPEMAARSQQPVPGLDDGTVNHTDWVVESSAHDDTPVRYLCGCPDKSGKVNVDDIRAFKFRIATAGANSGVLYSIKGFTQPAITMARVSGIACCQLFADRPAEVPHVVNVLALHARPEVRIDLQHIETLNPPPATWSELFTHSVQSATGETQSVLAAIGEAFAGAEKASIEAQRSNGSAFPPDVTGTIEFSGCRAQVRVTCRWRRFRAPHQSHLVNGSRMKSDEHAAVMHISPTISVHDADPGVKWEEVADGAPLPETGRRVLMLTTGSDPRPALIAQLSHQPLPKRADTPQTLNA